MGIEVFLSINNNEEVIQLPAPPEGYRIGSAFSNTTKETITQSLNIIGLRELKDFNITSFFPVRDYPFLQNRSMWGMEYVDTIERWRDRRIPIRIIIVSNVPTLTVNMAVTIDDFDYSIKKNGDIQYTLSFREFSFVKVGD